jgi:predicted small lipoprotein YifL
MRRAWLLPFLAALAAGGCGQKGPLYLPDKNAKVVTSPKPKTNGQDQDSQQSPQPQAQQPPQPQQPPQSPSTPH